jgi:pantoate--beta-alanine ligase
VISVVRTKAELRRTLTGLAGDVGLVPTMGALHSGHAALIARAAAANRTAAISIFVNPAQFNDPRDLERYPRSLDRDLALAEEAGAALAFVPGVEEVYPPGFATSVEVFGLTKRWEGASRPGHFRGVATVVAILLTLFRPKRAYFGEKDFQQLAVIRRMHADLGLWGEIVGCPTIREPDGLALSSRNVRLGPAHRAQAPVLHQAMQAMAAAYQGGLTSVPDLIGIGTRLLESAPDLTLEYLAVVDPDTLEPVEEVTDASARVLVAALLGTVRLIDNMALGA